MSSRKGRQDAKEPQMDIEQTVKDVLNVAFAIHSEFGPGMFESTYQLILARELIKMGHQVETEKVLSFSYKGEIYADAYRIDLMIDNELIVELKSTEQMHPVYSKQVLTYLKLSGKKLGLVLNFGVTHLKDGIVRLVNHY
jgi:iron complex transport system substrate-binding protein